MQFLFPPVPCSTSLPRDEDNMHSLKSDESSSEPNICDIFFSKGFSPLQELPSDLPSGAAFRSCFHDLPSEAAFRSCLQEQPLGAAFRSFLQEQPSGAAIGSCLQEMSSGTALFRSCLQELPSGAVFRSRL